MFRNKTFKNYRTILTTIKLEHADLRTCLQGCFLRSNQNLRSKMTRDRLQRDKREIRRLSGRLGVRRSPFILRYLGKCFTPPPLFLTPPRDHRIGYFATTPAARHFWWAGERRAGGMGPQAFRLLKLMFLKRHIYF